MPRKKVRLSPIHKRTEEVDDDDFLFDDSQSSSGKTIPCILSEKYYIRLTDISIKFKILD